MHCVNQIHAETKKPFASLGSLFCLSCLAKRALNIGEREREREKNSLSHKNNTIIELKDDYSISNTKYDNINLLDSYLSGLHEKVLPVCRCCKGKSL